MKDRSFNFEMTGARIARSTSKALEARRQDGLEVADIQVEPRELTTYERQCMRGHVEYLKLLDAGVIRSDNQRSGVRFVKRNTAAAHERFQEALVEFRQVGGSLYKFCKRNFERFGYRSIQAMHGSLRVKENALHFGSKTPDLGPV